MLGQHRLTNLTRPTFEGVLYGVLSTLRAGPGSQLEPVACPVATRKLDGTEEVETGLITEGSARFDAYRAILLRATAEDFVRLYPFD